MFYGNTIRYPKFAKNDICGCKHCRYCNKKLILEFIKK